MNLFSGGQEPPSLEIDWWHFWGVDRFVWVVTWMACRLGPANVQKWHNTKWCFNKFPPLLWEVCISLHLFATKTYYCLLHPCVPLEYGCSDKQWEPYDVLLLLVASMSALAIWLQLQAVAASWFCCIVHDFVAFCDAVIALGNKHITLLSTMVNVDTTKKTQQQQQQQAKQQQQQQQAQQQHE